MPSYPRRRRTPCTAAAGPPYKDTPANTHTNNQELAINRNQLFWEPVSFRAYGFMCLKRLHYYYHYYLYYNYSYVTFEILFEDYLFCHTHGLLTVLGPKIST